MIFQNAATKVVSVDQHIYMMMQIAKLMGVVFESMFYLSCFEWGNFKQFITILHDPVKSKMPFHKSILQRNGPRGNDEVHHGRLRIVHSDLAAQWTYNS